MSGLSTKMYICYNHAHVSYTCRLVYFWNMNLVNLHLANIELIHFHVFTSFLYISHMYIACWQTFPTHLLRWSKRVALIGWWTIRRYNATVCSNNLQRTVIHATWCMPQPFKYSPEKHRTQYLASFFFSIINSLDINASYKCIDV